MSSEGTIILYSILTFCGFLASQIVVFRLTHQDDALRWLAKLYCLGGAVLCLGAYGDPSIAVGSFLLYSGFSFVYMLCIFGPIEASITLRILSEIGTSGGTGITHAQLLRRYNNKLIVRRRIERFVKSGDLKIVKGKYYRTGRLTAFTVREHTAAAVRFLLLHLSDS